ncbi:MAG: hypothetical protein V1737_02030 [Chloroflexota bacterium]
MAQAAKFKPYKATVSEETLERWSGVVRVWNEPKSAVDGGEVVDQIKEPIAVTVVEEQLDMYGSKPQRARIEYGQDKQGWVIYEALVKKQKQAQQPIP